MYTVTGCPSCVQSVSHIFMYTDIHVRQSVLYSDSQVRSFVFESVINTKVCTEVV